MGGLHDIELQQAGAHHPAAERAACSFRDQNHRDPWAPLWAGTVPQDVNMAGRAGCWQQAPSKVLGMASDEPDKEAIREPSQEEETGPEAELGVMGCRVLTSSTQAMRYPQPRANLHPGNRDGDR